MEQPVHSLSALFEQLGLPAGEAGIADFVAQHRPLADSVKLAEAPFWEEAQAAFLREELAEDADWSTVIDQLDAMLRA